MFPFENLEVYKKALLLNKKIYAMLKTKPSLPSYIKSQLGRSTLSIMLNIAEGSAKQTNKDRKNFFVIARGSTFECYSLINFLHEESEITDDFKTSSNSCLEEISKILFAMIKNLKPN